MRSEQEVKERVLWWSGLLNRIAMEMEANRSVNTLTKVTAMSIVMELQWVLGISDKGFMERAGDMMEKHGRD